MSFLSPLYALDLGTETTRVYSADEGLLKEIPTARTKEGRIVKRGRLTDERLASAFVSRVLTHEFRRPFAIAKPRLAASVPASFSPVEKIALYKALVQSGASGVELVSTGLAAACGAGVDLNSDRATVLLGMGDSVSELAVIVSGHQVYSKELTLSMQDLEEALAQEISQELGLNIVPEILGKLLRAYSPLGELKKDLVLAGKEIESGALREVKVPKGLIQERTLAFFEQRINEIEMSLRDLPSALATDVVEQGILMYGGMSGMEGLALFLAQHLGLPVSCIPEYDTAVIRGLKELVTSITFTEIEDEKFDIQILGC